MQSNSRSVSFKTAHVPVTLPTRGHPAGRDSEPSLRTRARPGPKPRVRAQAPEPTRGVACGDEKADSEPAPGPGRTHETR